MKSSGIIIQWGLISATTTQAAAGFYYNGTPAVITFPIAFPLSCVSLTFGMRNNGGELEIGVHSDSTTNIGSNVYLVTSAVNNTASAFWQAIGY